MTFQVDEFVFSSGRLALVKKVETPHRELGTECDMGRYTIEFVDRSTLSNAPGYLMRAATEEEVEATLRSWEAALKQSSCG